MIREDSGLARAFCKGPVDDCPIIDMHAHMGHLREGFLPRKSADGMLKTMDACGTALTIFTAHDTLFTPAATRERTMEIEVARSYPTRFRCYYGLPSTYLQFETDIRRFEAHPEVFVGFKIISNVYRKSLTDPIHTPYWEYADHHELPVLVHTWSDNPFCDWREVSKVLDQHRRLQFIAGHSFHGDWKIAVRMARRYPNLFLELTGDFDDRGAIEVLAEAEDGNRLLFGTDLPYFSTLHGVGAVLSAEIDDSVRRKIFHGNAERLLGRYQWFRDLWLARP